MFTNDSKRIGTDTVGNLVEMLVTEKWYKGSSHELEIKYHPRSRIVLESKNSPGLTGLRYEKVYAVLYSNGWRLKGGTDCGI